MFRNAVYGVVKWNTCIVSITRPAVLIWLVVIIVVVITVVAIVVVAMVVVVVAIVVIWPVMIQKWIPVGHMSFIRGMLLCPSLILIQYILYDIFEADTVVSCMPSSSMIFTIVCVLLVGRFDYRLVITCWR